MDKQVRLSKKQRTVIGNLVNTVAVWYGLVKDGIAEGKDVTNAMKWHDEAVEELRQLLGVKVTAKYSEQ